MDKKIVYYFPLYLAILLVMFLSIFSLDVFSEGYKLGELLLALFMHLIPSILLIIVIIIAWKKRVVGGVIFLLLGLISIIFFRSYSEFVTFLITSLPMILIGSLLLLVKKK